MSNNRYPAAVDVAIVGSGPTASAYARILSEEAPGATIAMFEVGPTVSNPPGAHVKNIEDPDRRSLAQRASEGPGAGAATVNSPGAVKSGDRRARPGTYLLQDGYAFPGEDVAAELANAGDLIKYVQVADAPGRGEPGSGSIDWPARFADLRTSGYTGPIGLEYYPTIDSAKSVRSIQELVAGR